MKALLPTFCIAICLSLNGCGPAESGETYHSDSHEHRHDSTHDHGEGHGDGHAHHHGDHNKSNAYMNQSDFEALVARFEDPERAAWQKPEAVIEMLGPLEGKKVMDIGAGTGYFSRRLAQKGAEVISADVDDRFLAYMEEKIAEHGMKNVQTRKVPYDDPKLAEAEVDAVLIVNTWHHIDGREAYFKKVLQGLKADGRLMVVDYKKEDTPHGPPVDHRFSDDDVVAELLAAGFGRIVRDLGTLPEQYIVIATK